jgi:hypothetical protein
MTRRLSSPMPRRGHEDGYTAVSRVRGRILADRDMARATPPSEIAEVIADEVNNPAIREGDVLVLVVGRRLTARVASGLDVGAYLSPSVFLIRPDTATNARTVMSSQILGIRPDASRRT